MSEAVVAIAGNVVSMERVVDCFTRLTQPGDFFRVYLLRDMFKFINLLSIVVR